MGKGRMKKDSRDGDYHSRPSLDQLASSDLPGNASVPALSTSQPEDSHRLSSSTTGGPHRYSSPPVPSGIDGIVPSSQLASSTIGSVDVGPGAFESDGSQTVDNTRGWVTDTSLDASFSAASMVFSTDGVRSVDGRPSALDSRCRSASSLDMVMPRMNLTKRSP